MKKWLSNKFEIKCNFDISITFQLIIREAMSKTECGKEEGEINEKDRDCDGEGHLYGNFSDYYSFNGDLGRVEKVKDVIMEMEKERKEEYYVLDIGCNSGVLTFELLKMCLQAMKNIHILGIDIDEKLICKAKENIPSDLKV